MIPFSILDLAPITVGATAGDALKQTLAFARQAERLGYRRFWLAEHHNMAGIASAATSVVIGYVAGGTSTIRVGSGGVMLPNHSPLVIAEQFGTLESLYPGRIDLGLGRAPGTDMLTAHALRRDLGTSAEQFPQEVQELQAYLGPPDPSHYVRAVPGAGLRVPIWLLGSSLFSAELAAELGLPFAFASHFAPDDLLSAIEVYRRGFKPSAELARPYVMPTVVVVAADSEHEARRQFTSHQQASTNIHRGTRGLLPAPIDDIDAYWTPVERAQVERRLRYAVVGTPESLTSRLRSFLDATKADELMVTAHFYDQAARVRSIELLAEVRERL
jgi:luciferase family oxidoreductase group 1